MSSQDNGVQKPRLRSWQTALELSPGVFQVRHESEGAISPVAIAATTDPDGMRRAAMTGLEDAE